MKVEIANITFEFKSLDNNYLNERMKKYKTEKNPDIIINLYYVNHIEVLEKENVFTNNFYELYKTDSGFVQYQKSELNKEFYGKIAYLNKSGNIILLSRLTKTDKDYYEYFLLHYLVTYFILKEKTAILMHGSAISYHNKAYIFTAKSGTGKSTHVNLWTKYTNAVCINDDKNYLIYENNKIWVYGNPWSGKHSKDENIKVELKSIIYLYQNKDNIVKDLKGINKLKLIMGQIIQINPLYDVKKWEFMLDRILEIKSYHYGCNMEKEAVNVIKREVEL